MADKPNSTVLTVQVGGANVDIDSIAKAKKAIKDLNSEILAGNQAAVKQLAEVKDRLDDVKEATQTVAGSGVEKLTSSFSLLSQGFTNFDADKIKTGFKGIGAAMGAIPIFLLIQGITLLIENFDIVIDFVEQFTSTTKEAEKAAAALTTQITKEVDATKGLIDINAEYTKTELLRLQSLGASAEELEEVKRRGFLNDIRRAKEGAQLATDYYNQLLRNNSATTEQIKLAGEKQIAANGLVKRLTAELTNFQLQSQIDLNKKLDDLDNERIAKNKEQAAKIKAQKESDKKELFAFLDASINEESALLDKESKEISDRQKQRDADRIAGLALIAKIEKDLRDQANIEANISAQESIKLAEDVEEAKLNAAINGIQGAKDLTEAFFNFQKNKAGEDVAKQNELAKKAFVINKGLQLAQAGLEGYRSVISTYAATPGGLILKGVAAATAGLVAAGMIAKIASVKFKGADAADTTASTDTSISSAPVPAPPTISNIAPQQQQTTTINNNLGGRIVAEVVETQSRAVTDRVNSLVAQSSYP
jgi:hypothetical protein